jgi:hypothetical protein
MSKKINGFIPLGYSPYSARPSSVDRKALQSAHVNGAATADATRSAGNRDGASPRSSDSLSTAERRMILRAFPENPDLSLRLYGPNRDAQTINPSAVGNQLDVQG